MHEDVRQQLRNAEFTARAARFVKRNLTHVFLTQARDDCSICLFI